MTGVLACIPMVVAGLVSRPAPPVAVAPPADTLLDVGGHRLHFRIWPGTGDLTLVFQAGGGADLTSWLAVPSRAAERTSARVLAYDRAGLGASEVGPIDLTPEMELDHLDRALDRLGVGRIVLVGHSYGGLLSLVHAARRPDRVAGLVLVDPMNFDFIEAMGLPWLTRTAPEVRDPRSARDTVVYRMQRTIGDLVERGRATPPAIVPTIVITAGVGWWGSAEADTAWRRSHERLAAQEPRHELVVAARSRHDIPGTEPEVIVSALVRMLARVR